MPERRGPQEGVCSSAVRECQAAMDRFSGSNGSRERSAGMAKQAPRAALVRSVERRVRGKKNLALRSGSYDHAQGSEAGGSA
jgi:hypothetical protein